MDFNRSASESIDELHFKSRHQPQTELANLSVEKLNSSLQQLNSSPVANLLLSTSASNLRGGSMNDSMSLANDSVSFKWPPFDSTQIDDEFKCPKCKEVMFNVHQADECGCRFCFECLNRMFARLCLFYFPSLLFY
jgi:hypothetical protein